MLCAKHRAEYDRWLDACGPGSGNPLTGLGGIPLVSIGNYNNSLTRPERVGAKIKRVMQSQLKLITDECKQKEGCSDEAR